MPAFTDIANGWQVGQSIAPQSATSTVTGTGIDFQDCAETVTGILNVGDIGGGTTVAVKLQESKNDNSADAGGTADAYSDISGATFTSLSDSSDNSVEAITVFNRAERYVRMVATFTGSTPDAIISGTLLAQKTSY